MELLHDELHLVQNEQDDEQDMNLRKMEIRYTRVANCNNTDFFKKLRRAATFGNIFLGYKMGTPALKLHKQEIEPHQNNTILKGKLI